MSIGQLVCCVQSELLLLNFLKTKVQQELKASVSPRNGGGDRNKQKQSGFCC